MDVKLKTSGMLLRKLAFGCGDAQLHAVAEIRLFAKWDDENRACLGRAGAIGPLIKLMYESPEGRVRENAMLALLNISINPENKLRMVREEEHLEAVMQLAKQDESAEVKASAAALLYSLVADNEARKIASRNENLWSTLIEILRDGSAKCKAEVLKALFVAAGDNLIREKLLQEDLQTISLLISIVTVGKVKLTEDCLTVLALLASWEAGASAITQVSTSIPVLVYLVSSGMSPRVQENAASVLMNICQNNREAQRMMPLQALVPALNRMYWGGSERGKGKAEALLGLLGFDLPLSQPIEPISDVSYNVKPNTMPILAPHPHASSRPPPSHQSSPSTHPPSSSPIPLSHASSSPKASFSSKYFSLAKSFFSHKPRKRSHSISS